MPTLALLAACERSIIEAETKAISMIGLFTGVKASVPAGETPPANAASPKEWSIVSGWDGNKGEAGKEFVQCLAIFFPDGKPFVERNELKFTIDPGKRHHVTTRLLAFPIGQLGKCHVQVWAEFGGKPVTDKTSIYINVEHEVIGKPK